MKSAVLVVAVAFQILSVRSQLLTFKDGRVGVNFGGYHASAGLGGGAGGRAAGGGLFAEAGTPWGAQAGAGLGGGAEADGRAGGGLYAGATAGGGVGAAAGLGGGADASGVAGGGLYAGAQAGGHQAGSTLIGGAEQSGGAVITKTATVTGGAAAGSYDTVVPLKHKKVHKTYVASVATPSVAQTSNVAAGTGVNTDANVAAHAEASATANTGTNVGYKSGGGFQIQKTFSAGVSAKPTYTNEVSILPMERRKSFTKTIVVNKVKKSRKGSNKIRSRITNFPNFLGSLFGLGATIPIAAKQLQRPQKLYTNVDKDIIKVYAAAPAPVLVPVEVPAVPVYYKRVHHHRRPAHKYAWVSSEPAPIKRVDVDVAAATQGQAVAGAGAGASGGADVAYQVTAQKSPTFFADIFNIPISTLSAVSKFLGNTASGSNISVHKQVSFDGEDASKYSGVVQPGQQDGARPSSFIDDVFSIPISTLGAVNKFLENNVANRKVVAVTQGDGYRTGRAYRRGRRPIVIVEKPQEESKPLSESA